jgi:hypothetical protein
LIKPHQGASTEGRKQLNKWVDEVSFFMAFSYQLFFDGEIKEHLWLLQWAIGVVVSWQHREGPQIVQQNVF